MTDGPPYTRECPGCGAVIDHDNPAARATARRAKSLCPDCRAGLITFGAKKRCSSCHLDKTCSEFSSSPPSRDGLESRCKGCKNSQQRQRCRTILGRIKELVYHAIDRSREKGLLSELTNEMVQSKWDKQGGCCLLTGIPFDLLPLGNGRSNPFAPSLDRIDPTKGYTDANTRLVCWGINIAKSTFTTLELLRFAVALTTKAIEKNNTYDINGLPEILAPLFDLIRSRGDLK